MFSMSFSEVNVTFCISIDAIFTVERVGAGISGLLLKILYIF